MNQMVQIANQEIQIKEYNGQRVITFKDIDLVHKRPNTTARQNFNRNKKHFIEGEDFFKISSYEIHTMGIETKSNYPNGLILITESGYLMLVKTFTDDLSWDIQKQLVNCYFRVRNETCSENHELTKDDWMQLGELISKTPKDRFQYLLVVLNNVAPGLFDVLQSGNNKMAFSEDFASILKRALKANNMTQSELAEKIHCGKSSISQYCSGTWKPSAERLLQIANVLHLSVSELC